MAEYFVVQKGSTQYQVSKTEEGQQIKSQYTVTEDQHGFYCTCPRWMKRKTVSCRHTELVSEWIKLGKPQPYMKELP